MACSMGTSVGYDRARNKVSGGPMAHPLAHCQLESRFQLDTFVSTLKVVRGQVKAAWCPRSSWSLRAASRGRLCAGG